MNRSLPVERGASRPLSPAARLLARIVSRTFNWHWIEPGLARAAQTYGWQTPLLLRHHRIASLVNLRGDNTGSPWYDNERKACADLGVAYLDVSLSSKRLPEREHLVAALDAVREAPRPALIKCSGGADRTGFVAGLHFLERYGLSAMPQARRQLAYWPYLHIPKPRQRWIRAFLDYIEADIGDRGLREWIETGYEAGRFEAFLVGRGQHRYWKRN
jgi:hypothetical protein